MKNYSLLLIILMLIGCQNEDISNKVNELQNLSPNFIYTLLRKDKLDTVYRQAYLIRNGRVLFEKYINYDNPEYNHVSAFEYDNNGRVIKEIREDQVFTKIFWDNNKAKVFNKNDELIYEFQFNSSNQILSYKYVDKITSQTRFFNYDTNGNVVSAGTEAGINVEFLNYNSSLINPLSIINSIAILRIDYKPNFKNIFKTEKTYPYKGVDYSVPMTIFNYSWTLNKNGLIETIADDKTFIYLSKFEYE